MARNRGAQPGNINALKHGFYSRQLRDIDLADLETITADLGSEIALLRSWIRRLAEFAGQQEYTTLEDMTKTLHGLSAAAKQVAFLSRMQTSITGDANSSLAAINEALRKIAEDYSL